VRGTDGLCVGGVDERPGHGRADEEDLLRRLRGGDEAAFASVVDSWSGAMLHVARMYVSTVDSAQEVVQDAWLGVLRGLASFEGRSSLRTWVFRILVNTAKSRGVRERRVVPFSALLDAAEDAPTVDPSRFRGLDEGWPGHWSDAGAPCSWPMTPESAVESAELRTLLSDVIATVPERQRVVLVLRDVQGCSSQEVCDLLDLSPENQRVLLHRARARARAVLENASALTLRPRGDALMPTGREP